MTRNPFVFAPVTMEGITMTYSKPLMTIEEFIVRDSMGPDKTEKAIIGKLNDLFSGSIAPILLLTEQSLAEVDGIGPKAMRFLKERLEAYRLEMRDFCERVDDRAVQLYGSIDKTPIQALYVMSASAGIATFSHYYDSPAVKLLSRLNPSMTIGDLIEMDRVQLGQYFALHGVSIDSHRSNILINEITARLRSWDKHLAKRSTHVASS